MVMTACGLIVLPVNNCSKSILISTCCWFLCFQTTQTEIRWTSVQTCCFISLTCQSFLFFYRVVCKKINIIYIKSWKVWWMCSPVKKVHLVIWRPVETALPATKQSFSVQLYQSWQKTWTLVHSSLQCGFSLWKFAVLNVCTALF